MADVDPIIVQISAEFGDLKKDLVKIQREMKGFGKEVDGVGKKTDKVGKGFKGTTNGILGDIKRIRADFGAVQFAVVAVAGAFIGAGVAITKTAEAFREMDKAANRLDIPVEEFSKFVVVAKKSGVNVDTLGDAMKDLNVKITDAAGGAKAYEDVFNKIGLKSAELVKLPVAEQFLKFSDAIREANSNTRRFALDEINDAMFQMIPLMEQGGDKIREMANEAERLGQSVSTSQADKLRAYNKQMTELGLAAENLANALAEHVVPALTEVARAVTDAVNGIAQIIESSDELTEALRKTREEAIEINSAFEKGRTIASAGAITMGQYSDEVLNAATSLEALATAGQSAGLDPFKNADASNFSLPEIPTTPEVDDINVMFSQELGGDNNGGTGGALARILAENEAIEEAAAEYQAEKLNRIFEEMLAEGELKEQMRVAEEEAHKAWLDRMFGADQRAQEQNAKLWKAGWEGKMAVASDFMGQMSILMNTNSRKQFEIGKAAAIAQVAIDTPKAAMSAYSAMAGIPFIGPALGVAAAGAAIASGVSQMQNIKAQSFGGGGSVGGSAVDAGGSDVGGSAQAPQNVIDASFNIQGSSVSADSVRGMLGSLNELIEDGGTLRSVTVI